MRVLFITQIVDRSHDNLGAVHGWIAALAREVEKLHVLALSTGAVDLPPNVTVHSLGKNRGNGKLAQWRVFRSVAGGLARRHEVDVFFPHMVPRYALLAAPYRLLYGVPTVMWYAHNSADLMLKAANLVVDRFVSPTPDSFPLDCSRCVAVGHGVDTQLFRPSPGSQHVAASGQLPGPTRFLTLGRISPRKELDTLVSAADLLVNQWGRRDGRFVVAGGPLAPEDRTYFEHIKGSVLELELEPFFEFTGGIPHSETVSHLQRSDYFVNMHVEGGLGKAVLEAMSCGLPALVSTPTYYRRFPEYAARFVFAPRDHEELARKMAGVLDMSPSERGRVGCDLRDWVVSEHDVRSQMSRIAELFRSVRGGPGPSRSA